MLLADTWTNCYDPHIGIAAVELLEALGYRVDLLDAGDLLRPMLSKGMARKARRRGQKLFHRLDRAGSTDMPILCLEPSDASALTDDLPDLLEDDALGQRVAKRVQSVDRLLADAIRAGFIRSDQLSVNTADRAVYLHGHCHQKALFGTESIHAILASIPGVTVEETDTGCCGMAGSFGYEHYDLSVQIAEQRLLPAVRQAVTEGKTIVACGTSCRQQLRDLLRVEAKHLVEILQVT